MQNQANDLLAANAKNRANISKEVTEVETAQAEGLYKVGCIGPVESFRARYVELRDRLGKKGIKAWFDRIVNESRWIAELATIPMEQKWADEFENVVTKVGKNLALDTYLAGSAYTVVGPYMFLINTNASSAVDTDTMASHPTWLEVGNANAPAYKYPNSGGSQVRGSVAWSSATNGGKSTSAPVSFYITSSGTVGGCGIVFGSGAVATIDSAGGTLYSAGNFTGGSKSVSAGDTLNCTYTASL